MSGDGIQLGCAVASVPPFMVYGEDVLLFHVECCLVFGRSKENIGVICAFLKTYYKTEDDV